VNASTRRSTSLLCALLTGVGLAVAGCGGAADFAPVNAPTASPHTAAEKAATLTWLDQTNQMWTAGDFTALNQVTTGEMRTVYQVEEQQANTPAAAQAGPRCAARELPQPRPPCSHRTAMRPTWPGY
jgi:hypothetical protein